MDEIALRLFQKCELWKISKLWNAMEIRLQISKNAHTQRNMIIYPNISEKLGLDTAQNGPPKGLSVGLHDS